MDNLIFQPVAIGVEIIGENPDGDLVLSIRELTSIASDKDAKTQSPDDASALQASSSELEADIARYESVIRELELKNGPYSAELVQQLMGIGSTLQFLNNHQQAIEVFERAQHINRVNHGLFNLDQSPIINSMIESEIALGRVVAADHLEEYLYYIQQKNFDSDSPEILPAMTQLAEWNLRAFNARFGPDPALPASESVDADTSEPDFANVENFRFKTLINAQSLYTNIISIIVDHIGITDPRLRDAEKMLALANYLFARHYGNVMFQPDGNWAINPAYGSYVTSGPMGYRQGKDAFERRIEYLKSSPDVDNHTMAEALIDLADWLLLFNKRTSALDAYQEAYNVLGTSNEAGTAYFHPAIPITLPTFMEGRYSGVAPGSSHDQGHIDVAFELNRFGLANDLRIIDKSPSTTDRIESLLLQSIRQAQFRPRFLEDSPAEKDPVFLRYYFQY